MRRTAGSLIAPIKTGHYENQIRPLVIKTGQYPDLDWVGLGRDAGRYPGTNRRRLSRDRLKPTRVAFLIGEYSCQRASHDNRSRRDHHLRHALKNRLAHPNQPGNLNRCGSHRVGCSAARLHTSPMVFRSTLAGSLRRLTHGTRKPFASCQNSSIWSLK